MARAELPVLVTARLRLRPARAADLDALHACWSHPEVARYLFDDQPVDAAFARRVLASSLEVAKAGQGLWAIEWPAGKDVVGCIGLRTASVPGGLAPGLDGLLEPIVALHPVFWRNGFAVEALEALQDHVFDALGRSCLVAIADEPNTASLRMLERAGFQRCTRAPGERHELVVMMLSRERHARLRVAREPRRCA